MKVKRVMTRGAKVCSADDALRVPAQIMWEENCGFVPVVGPSGRLAGVITDRDICMGAYTQGTALSSIPVHTAMAKVVHAVRPGDRISDAEAVMRDNQVRRLPVIDDDGRLVGVLSLGDLTRKFAPVLPGSPPLMMLGAQRLARTLAAICRPTPPEASPEPELETVAKDPKAFDRYYGKVMRAWRGVTRSPSGV